MAFKALLCPTLVRQLIRYDPDTGETTWRKRPVWLFADRMQTAEHACARWNARFAGRPAFTTDDKIGYKRGYIFNRQYLAHRVIWCLHYGAWPEGQIDHINGVRNDNRAANLRVVQGPENQRNMKRRRDNTSGVSGVTWSKDKKKWRAVVYVKGKTIFLGAFDTFDAAATARRTAEPLYGYHENHGREGSPS